MKKDLKIFLVSIVCFLVVLIILIGCKTSEKQIKYPKNQSIVFIEQYTNWSNGFVNRGHIIDKYGNVKEFNFTDKGYSNLKDNEAFISNLENLGDETIISKVGGRKVKIYYDIFTKIDENSKITKKSQGCDMGQHTIYGVKYNRDGTHKLILIDSWGDWVQKRNDMNAVKIKEWVNKVINY